MKKVILISCDGIEVDIIKELIVSDDNNSIKNGVRELFSEVFNNDYVGDIKYLDDILINEVYKEDIFYDNVNVEREFDCCNDWNSIVVVDGNLEELNFN